LYGAGDEDDEIADLVTGVGVTVDLAIWSSGYARPTIASMPPGSPTRR